MRIAVPVVARTMNEALYDIEEISELAFHQRHQIVVELRIDYMEKPDLKKLISSSSLPKIVTNRVQQEGGRFEGSEDMRFGYLQEAADLGAEYVDMELNYMRPIKRGSSTKLIVSNHNPDNTPRNLYRIYRRMMEAGADIPKIVTKANAHEDSLRMLRLISKAHAEGNDIIGICTGSEGMITRILGPVYGGYLTFVSLSYGKQSAEGQITAEELVSLSRILNI